MQADKSTFRQYYAGGSSPLHHGYGCVHKHYFDENDDAIVVEKNVDPQFGGKHGDDEGQYHAPTIPPWVLSLQSTIYIFSGFSLFNSDMQQI